ncbi:MAG: hypothetical protein LBK95_19745 [Bifidobacteriaceae bacterium]|jgi:hypothetical protein|nr:hypothetical protein [Bifidobacteriaceae bacterium]
MERNRLAAMAAGVAVVAGLAGCAQSDQVASIDRDGASPVVDPIAAQARAADEYVACLTGAGIPVETDPTGDGQTYVFIVPEGDHLMSGGGGPTGVSGEEPAWMLEMAAKYDPTLANPEAYSASGAPVPDIEPYLIIGQTDFTEDFRACLETSGYTEPVNYPDPEAEVAAKQSYLQATLDWIDCARSNGYPNIDDPLPVKADEWQTEPMAVLDADMSQQALRELLAVCPNFDEAAQADQDQAVYALGAGPDEEDLAKAMDEHPYSQPNIGFDLPGLDGDARPGKPTDPPEDHGVYALFEILREARAAYQEANPNPYCC